MGYSRSLLLPGGAMLSDARCFQLRDAFSGARQGVTVGWNDFFDRLEEYLAKMRCH